MARRVDRALIDPLAARLAGAGWGIVTTRRSDSAPITTSTASLHLEPLRSADRRRLALNIAGRDGLSDRALADIDRRSNGIPLFVEQLVRAHLAGVDIELAESAERIIGARIDALPGPARRALRQLSVLGDRAEVDVVDEVLAAVGGASSADRPLFDGPLAADLVEFVEVEAGRLRFHHDLVRLVAYEGLTFEDRVRLHEAAATSLSRRADTPAAILAEHFARAGHHDRALSLAADAARRAESEVALGDAARLWQLAADAASRGGRPAIERAGYLSASARCFETLAEPAQARSLLDEALALDDGSLAPDLLRRLGWIALRAEEFDATEQHLATAAAAGRSGDRTGDARLLLLRAALRSSRDELDDSNADATVALEIARNEGLDDVLGEALMQLALNASVADVLTDDLAHAAAEALGRGGRRLEIGLLWLNLAADDLEQGRWVLAEERLLMADRECRRSGHVLFGLFVDANLGGLLLAQGRAQESAELFGATARRARAARNARLADFADASAARAQAWLGDDSAVDRIVEAGDRLTADGNVHEAQDVAAYAIEALVMAGRWDEAVALAEPLREVLDRERAADVVSITVRRLVLVAQVPGGSEKRAVDGLTDLAEVARTAHASIETARILQALAAISLKPDPTWLSECAAICDQLASPVCRRSRRTCPLWSWKRVRERRGLGEGTPLSMQSIACDSTLRDRVACTSLGGQGAVKARKGDHMPGVKVDEIHGGNPEAGENASLYERLGGAYAIAGAVDYLIDRLHTNATLNINHGVEEFHADQYKAGYKFMVTAWSIEKAGGPKCYFGSDMAGAHDQLELTDYDFDVTAHEIRNTLYQMGVPQREVGEFMEIIESYRSDVVTPS